MRTRRLRQWSASNWFVLVAPVLAGAAWLISRSLAWPVDGPAMEAALLTDAIVTLPLLYAFCYGRSLPLWQLAVRMLGIACLGIYLLSYLIPADAQTLLPRFSWLRTAGVVVLALVELRILITGVRLLFRNGVTAQQLSAETGAPPLLAKLMLLEARMWKTVGRFLRGR